MTTPTDTLKQLLAEAETTATATEKALATAVREGTQRGRDARAAHLTACETRTNLRRALGLNADGTERKPRTRRTPETAQATLPETTDGEGQLVACEAQAQGVAA